MGFCRMYFWHWVQATSQKGEPTAVRAHGLPLQSRWNGTGEPPVGMVPPSRGSALLQQEHPFHTKMTPGITLGPRCNHDLGVLLRFLTSKILARLRQTRGQAAADLAQGARGKLGDRH